ncbi:MAG: Pseudouridine synthase [Parachlamydiales bacterium]|nr:Pseudouridine synthase [Parachlamydiales bacterium]
MTISAEPEIDSILITPQEAGQRIDQLLAHLYPSYSRTYFQKLIEDGFVLLNDKPVKKRIAPDVGDEIEVFFQLSPVNTLEPENIPLDILFEDEYLIAVNKPAGMVVHPAPGHWSGTFVNALLAHCDRLAPCSDPLRPGIVHRLDKETSGVLIAAKTAHTHQKLVQMFSSRKIKKTYLAICVGRPPNTTINAPIGRHPGQRKEMAIAAPHCGREAISHVQTLAFNDAISLAMIRPETGRTHQIRVHLKHLGHPVLGDATYGSDRMNDQLKVERHMLHAYRLDFKHPMTNASLSFLAPIPKDFQYWVHRISE